MPLNKKLPAEALSQAVKKVASSEPAMFVQVTAASEAIEPLEAGIWYAPVFQNGTWQWSRAMWFDPMVRDL